MALFNTLRNKMGKVVVGLIAFSIMAFVGADLLGPNSRLLRGNNTDIGKIAEKTISHQDYLNKIEQLTINFRINTQRNPSSDEIISIKNQAWEALIYDIAYQKQFDNVGIQVTNDEIIDMVQGNNISQEIKQAFTDSITGQFDKGKLITFLQNLAEATPAQRANWTLFESNLAPARSRTKYENLILKTNYASLEEGKQMYYYTVASADVKYVYISYNSIADSTITITDDELQNYIDNNQNEFQKKESRGLKYISIKIIPSEQDTVTVKEEIEQIKKKLAESDNDSTFVVINSDGNSPYTTYNRGTIPEALQEDGKLVEKGTIVGPFLEDGKYVLYKLSSIEEGNTNSARANHILFKWDNDSDEAKKTIKKKANKILHQLKNGADFAEMAAIHGTDGTKTKGGDLGWFSDGTMVAPFQEAVFGSSKKGLLKNLVETQFGYHIIEVTEVVTRLSYKVAKIELEFYINAETKNKFYRESENFALNSTNLESFTYNADKNNYQINTVNNIDKNDIKISTLTNARNIVFWLYNSGEIEKISNVFELDDEYIIAIMTEQQDKGVAKLESVRNQVEKKIRDAKKAEQIIAKMENTGGYLDNIAQAYGNDAKVYEMSNLKLSSNTLNTVGLAPEAVGLAFSMQNGEKTKPFKVESGVLVLELINKVEPSEISEYEAYINQIEQKIQGRLPLNINQALNELIEIEDLRYKFF